ncbi:MAG: LacI family transcriptional regulator [Bifidobacteriaceae bacterium]|jgi:DNA-binding LacI/PurR family transcriptional regulator|nr:LacI family transcriptional regulator [Bifidobacteriaceae bacterium]
MAATLRDVATYAGVSIRTVSNVMAGYKHVSETMRARVQDAITELGYRPNPVARRLRTGKTGLLAFVVPEIDVPYFSKLARDVIQAATQTGFHVMTDQTGHDRSRQRELLRGADRMMLFDGVLFCPLATAEDLQGAGCTQPLVLLGEHTFDGRFDHVAIDNVQAANDATSHLIAQGRRRLAAIGAQPGEDFATPLQRTEGFTKALIAAGLDLSRTQVCPAAHYSREDGYRTTAALISGPNPPDGIFCYSDLLAMGAIRAVFDAGLNVPEDIAIIGVDNIEEGQFARPSLSTISLDTRFIAEKAVAAIAARIEDPSRPAQQILAPHALIARESTGKAET